MEGSNTLTRSLIVFGQGLNKSHPYVFSLLDSILDNNIDKFGEQFNKITAHSIYLLLKSYNIRNDLQQQIINFANLTNFVALKGGAIKREQMLSGDMADIFSNLYLAISVQYYHKHNNTSELLTDYIVDKLMYENQLLINKVIDNMGIEKIFLFHMKKNAKPISYKRERDIFKEIMNNPVILENIKKNIEIQGVLKDMQDAIKLDKSSPEFIELHKKIINVGEYPNNSIQL